MSQIPGSGGEVRRPMDMGSRLSSSKGVNLKRTKLEGNNSRPYQQAIRMVHKGASVDEIMSICEMSRGEAELIVMMHRMDKAS